MTGTRRIQTISGTRKAAFVVVAMSILCAPVFAAGSITVKNRADIKGSNILVGDIAVMTGVAESEKDRISKLVLGLSPPPNTDYVLTLMQVKGRLHKAGIDLDKYKVKIPSKVTIHRMASIITGKDLMKSGISFLNEKMSEVNPDMSFEAKSYPRDIVFPYGKTATEFLLDVTARDYGLQGFMCKVYLDGVHKRTVSLSSYLRAYKKVVSAGKDVEEGAVLSESDLITDKAEALKLRRDAVTNIADAIGKKTLRKIRIGEIVTRTMLEDVSDINSGDQVTVVFKGNGFEVSEQAKALEKGYKGQSIRVIMEKSRKVISGIVIDGKTVEVPGN